MKGLGYRTGAGLMSRSRGDESSDGQLSSDDSDEYKDESKLHKKYLTI